MKMASPLLVVALLAVSGCSGKHTPAASFESAVPPPAAVTPEMRLEAATKLARDTLGEFDQRLAHPPSSQTYIAVKAAFEEEGVAENLWIGDVTPGGDGYQGKIVTEPVRLKKFAWGQPAAVQRSQVLDWFAVDDGKLVGGYAMRLERSQLSAIERADFDAHMGFSVLD